MKKEFVKFAVQLVVIALVVLAVDRMLGLKRAPKPVVVMPSGVEWVTGIVDGPSAEPDAVNPAVVMG